METNAQMESTVTGVQIKKSTNIVLNIFFILLAIIVIYPLLLVFSISITNETSVPTYGYSLIPHEFSAAGYEYIFGNFNMIGKAYLVSICITLIGGGVGLLIMAMYAYPLARDDFKYKSLFNLIAVITMLFSGGLVPTYMVYVNFLHLKDTYLAMVLPSLFSAFYVMIIRSFYKSSVPKSLIEASQIDGGGEFFTFFRIVLPLAKPALATVTMFTMLVYWNDWYFPMLYLENQKMYNLQYLLYTLDSQIQSLVIGAGHGGTIDLTSIPTETARMAMAIVAIGPVILAYPFFQRYFQKGITLGATKE